MKFDFIELEWVTLAVEPNGKDHRVHVRSRLRKENQILCLIPTLYYTTPSTSINLMKLRPYYIILCSVARTSWI